ncbi:MAG: type II toxin-antitoxin system VapC family toxin [Actinobacteria bacterium]|nr:type II toxin-antitoxin system VapC family toxin [Actinomycetota bacterium]
MNDDYYLESSAFTKRYAREPGSDFLDKLFLGNNRLFYLSITFCEILKVLYRLYKYPQHNERSITEAEFNRLNASFASDLLLAKRIALTDEILIKSREILDIGYLKSAIDILQLAGFLITKDVYSDLTLITADDDLANFALMFTVDVVNLNKI